MQQKRIRQNFMVFRLINRKNLKGLCDKWRTYFLELNQGFVAMKILVRAGGSKGGKNWGLTLKFSFSEKDTKMCAIDFMGLKFN